MCRGEIGTGISFSGVPRICLIQLGYPLNKRRFLWLGQSHSRVFVDVVVHVFSLALIQHIEAWVYDYIMSRL